MEFALNPTARWTDPSSWFVAPQQRRADTRRSSPAVAQSTAGALRTLARGATLSIEQPLGQEIFCIQGSLWITHDGDCKDHVIDAGKGYVANRHARVVVYALKDARLLVEPLAD